MAVLVMDEEQAEALIERVLRRVLGEVPAVDDGKLFTTREAAEYLHLAPSNRSSLSEYHKSGRLQAVRRGRALLFRKSALDAFLSSQTKGPTPG